MMELPFEFRDPFTRSSFELSTLEHLTFLKNQDHAFGISNALSVPNRHQLNINSQISKETTSQKRIKTSPCNVSSTALSEFQSNVDSSVLGINRNQAQIYPFQGNAPNENFNPLISRHIFSADTLCSLPQDGYQSHVWTLPAVQGKVPMISSTLNQDFKIIQKQTLQQASMITDANPWCRRIDSLHQSLYGAQHSTGNNNTRQGQLSILLYLSPQDDDHLSDYQCLVRKQIEYFEAGEDDVHTTAQGRNKPISLKQVGIRCRHCSQRLPQHRTRGSTYYPTKLRSIYQAAQNLARIHLCNNCPLIPEIVRREIIRLRTTGAVSKGKRYWAQSGKLQGIIESNDVLLLKN
jgi:hypothetical protein